MARFRVTGEGGFAEAFGKELSAEFAGPATKALRELGDTIKEKGRADMAAAGFSRRFQNALRVDVFPKKRASLRAALVIRSKVPYSEVFEQGATISGKPDLWIPLSSAPAGKGGRRLAAKDYQRKIGHPLYSATIGGKTFLGAYVRSTEARFEKKGVSLSLLRRGRNPGGRGEVRFVPLYLRQSSVSIAKKFDVYGIAEREERALPALFAKHITES